MLVLKKKSFWIAIVAVSLFVTSSFVYGDSVSENRTLEQRNQSLEEQVAKLQKLYLPYRTYPEYRDHASGYSESRSPLGNVIFKVRMVINQEFSNEAFKLEDHLSDFYISVDGEPFVNSSSVESTDVAGTFKIKPYTGYNGEIINYIIEIITKEEIPFTSKIKITSNEMFPDYTLIKYKKSW
ncbi:hypothetical protein ACFOLF_21760 [Paenibacillus sepulcri]|uniref:Uncharacterized protein n=1 Tax=Paenibacillus sepulcri TaxID=359917 RepID=A0ABS7C0U4_9BACL|nr:hypothetical protein [Paenibacillus sepulcri]